MRTERGRAPPATTLQVKRECFSLPGWLCLGSSISAQRALPTTTLYCGLSSCHCHLRQSGSLLRRPVSPASLAARLKRPRPCVPPAPVTTVTPAPDRHRQSSSSARHQCQRTGGSQQPRCEEGRGSPGTGRGGPGGRYLWPWAAAFMWPRMLVACLSSPSTLRKCALLSTRFFTALQAYSTV